MKRSVQLARSILLWLTAAALVLATLLLANPGARAQAPEPAAKTEAPHGGNLQNGKRLYASYGCYECHGRVGQGSIAGPRLAPHPVSLSRLVEYCRHPTGEMPPYTTKLVSDAELADVYVLLQSVPDPPAAKKLPH